MQQWHPGPACLLDPCWSKQQTMLANAMRGLANRIRSDRAERYSKARGTHGTRWTRTRPLTKAGPSGDHRAARPLSGIGQEGIETFEAEIVAHARHDETARRLATIPGIGPITASLIAGNGWRYFSVQDGAAVRRLARPGYPAQESPPAGKTRLGRDHTKTGRTGRYGGCWVLGATSVAPTGD